MSTSKRLHVFTAICSALSAIESYELAANSTAQSITALRQAAPLLSVAPVDGLSAARHVCLMSQVDFMAGDINAITIRLASESTGTCGNEIEEYAFQFNSGENILSATVRVSTDHDQSGYSYEVLDCVATLNGQPFDDDELMDALSDLAIARTEGNLAFISIPTEDELAAAKELVDMLSDEIDAIAYHDKV